MPEHLQYKEPMMPNKLRPYSFPLMMLFSIIIGCITGYFMGERALLFKPLGDIFLNLLFTAVVPLVFFSIASAITHIAQANKMLKIIIAMFATFIFTGIIAALFMIAIVKLFPPAQGMILPPGLSETIQPIHLADQIVSIFSVPDFLNLLSHNNMLPLIVFSILIGFATIAAKEKGKTFSLFLASGTAVFMQVISYIMYLAPLGFFSYFAVLAGQSGSQLIQQYLKIFIIYYVFASIYFVSAFSFYAYLAGGITSVTLYWKNNFLPMITAFATCSSAASIPANLQSTQAMKVSPDIYETVIPMGAMLHKDGSVLGAIIKIAFLFQIYGMPFNSPFVLLIAVVIALLVGTVMGAIPSGGMLGEMLILSFYGFPPQSLIMIAAISIIIDPLATMINVTGDSVCSMMVDRFLLRKS